MSSDPWSQKKWKNLDLVTKADVIRAVKANEKASVTEVFEIRNSLQHILA